MSDNVTTQSSSLASVPPGTVIASEDIGSGVQVQRVKVTFGADGTATNPTSSAPFPVDLHWTATNTNPLSVSPSSQWTVTTTPSSQVTISALLTNPLGWLSSSTSTSISVPPIIGSVAPSSQWTVSVTPTSAISVTPSSQWTVTTTPSSQIAVNAILSNPLGWLSSSTSTSITAPPIIGSVAPSSQWTVATTPSTTLAVINTSSTAVIGSVILTSGTQVIGSVAPSSTWTVGITSSTAQIGSVAASSQWTVTTTPSSQITVTALTTAVQAFAADTATLMSSGTVVTPLYHTVTSTTTGGLTVITTAVASKVQIALAVHVSNGSLSVPVTVSWRTGTSSSTLLAPMSLSAGANVVLPYNPVGWFTSPSTEGFSINITSTSSSSTVALPIGGCITYAAA